MSSAAPRGWPRLPQRTRTQRRSDQCSVLRPEGSESDLHAVVGRQDLRPPLGAGDLLEPARLGEERGDSLVVGDGLVVVEAQALGARHLAELESDDVARVAPVLLDRRGLGQRVLGVEDHEIGVTEELREGFDLRQIVLLVLGVGRVDDDLVVGFESIAVRVTAVALELGPHAQPGDLVVAIGLEPHEFDRGRQSREINREEWRRVLAAKGFLQLGVAAVNPDVIAGRVDRHEERKAHDVIQVRMGHERVEPLARGPAGGEDLVAEDPSPRAQVAQHVVPPAGDDLHAGRATAKVWKPPWALAWLEARMSARNPTLLMYATPAKSRTTRSWPSPQRVMWGASAALKSSEVEWSMRPSGDSTTVST